MFVSIPNSEGHKVQLCPQTMQHPRDLPDIPATSFSPSQPGCNTERGTILGGMEGEETGKRPSESASRLANVHMSYVLLH